MSLEPVEPEDGAEEGEGITLDPFTRHRDFAAWVRTGKLATSFDAFLAAWKPPIDTKVDKIMDLEAIGRPAHQFLKPPRPKRNDEYPEGYEDRLKQDLERQFILRNLARYVKTVDKDEPLEFEHKTVGVKLELKPGLHLKDLHRKPELLDAIGVDHVRRELAWRYRMLEVMQWERYYCKEIKDEFTGGPLWKHDPETNPVIRRGEDEADASDDASGSRSAGAPEDSAE